MTQKYIIDKEDLPMLIKGEVLALDNGNAFSVEVNGTLTNGDVIKAMWNSKAFSYVGGKELEVYFCDFDYSIYVSTDWWNSPYKEGDVNVL